MIEQVHLGNFKCFDKLSLPLAPLTLLTGFNAGGKSTAIQVLLLLAQTLRSAPDSRRIALNGPLAQLGTAAEVMKGDGRTLTFGAQTAQTSMDWVLGTEERRTATALDILSIHVEDADEVTRFDFPVKSSWRENVSKEAIDLLEAIRSIIFISAVRSGLSPTFPSPEDVEPVHADVGVYGQFAPWWLAQSLDEEVDQSRRHESEQGITLRRQVGAWAGELFPGAEVNADFLNQTGLVLLQLRRSISEDWRRPANIGYGLSYALPILVAGLLAKPDQVLIIDSPEAHLHPRAQSNIAKFLATMVKAGVQVVLESHSDHVLNGVRLAVKNGLLSPGQVAVHFFTGTEKGAPPVVTAHIDTHGGVSDWPTGFFDQAERDLESLAGWGS